jgi:autotransporter-associated beta strand protein
MNPARPPKLLALVPLLLLSQRDTAAAASRTWDGGDASTNLTAASNWNPNAAPLAGDSLVFPVGPAAPDRTVNNNFPANTEFDSLTFNDGGYTLEGVIMKLAGDLTATGAGTVVVNCGITRTGWGKMSANGGGHLHFGGASQLYQGDNSITLYATAGSAITMDGVLSAPGSLFMYGGGVITLNGAKSLGGNIHIWDQRVVLNHGNGLGSGGTGRIELVGSTLQMVSASNQTMPRDLRMSGASDLHSSGGDHTYSGDWQLYGNAHRNFVVTSGSLTLTGSVATEGEDSGVLVKQGPGTMRLAGTGGNAFADTLRVDEGVLELDKPGFAKKAVSCTQLQVGNGLGAPGSARVVLLGHSQIADDASVSVFSDGYLDLQNHAQWFSHLELHAGGVVNTGNDMGLFLPGNLLVAGGTAAAPAMITGRMVIMGVGREWTVADFGQETELICNAGLTKNEAMPNEAASVVINGAGNVTLGGTHTIDSLTYSGTGRLTGTTGFSEEMDLTLNSGTLSGSWNAGGVSTDGGVGHFLAVGGVVDLRDAGATRLLTCTGCTLGPGSTYRYQAEAGGSAQDAIAVHGSVTINHAVLEFIPPINPNPTPGTEYALVWGTHVVPQSQFLGMPEGMLLDGRFLLSYHGGDGDDVTATLIVPPTGVTRTWDGGGANNLWTTAANWDGNIVPQPGDALVFPAIAQRKTNTNNFVDGTGFHSVTVAAGDYQISGSRILLNDRLHFAHASGTPLWGVPVEFLLPGVVSADDAGALVSGLVDFGNNSTILHKTAGPGELTFSGGLAGDHPCALVKSGDGTVRLTQEGSFNGSVTVESGRLTVSQNDALSANAHYVHVYENAELRLDANGGPALVMNKDIYLYGILSVAAGPQCEWQGRIHAGNPNGCTIQNEGGLLCRGVMDGFGPLHKTGPGILTLNGNSPNENGALLVDEGEVRLAMIVPDAMHTSPIIVGGAGSAARLTLTAANQLADEVEVHVQQSGTFDAAAFSDRLGALTMTGGSVTGTSTTPLTLTTGLITSNASAMTSVITARIAAAAGVNGRFVIADGSAAPDLSIQSRVYGAVFEKTGPGRVDFTASQPLEAFDTLDLQQGSALFFNNSQFTNILLNGGTLGGNGTVGDIKPIAGGVISPGAGTGAFGAYKATWNAATTLSMELNGLSPGIDYDQYFANAALDLGSSKLVLAAGFDPAPGESFMIIRNVSGEPVSGTFAGIPEGGYVSAPGARVFALTYAGGDGDDVVVTRVLVDAPQVVAFSATPGTGPNAGFREIHLEIKGTPGLHYQLEKSDDLKTWATAGFGPVDLLTGLLDFDFLEPENTPRLFFRVSLP